MKSLKINFVGPMRRPGPARQMTVDPSELGTVSDLLRRLGYDEREMAVLNVLSEGDRLHPEASQDGVESVEILVAIGGG